MPADLVAVAGRAEFKDHLAGRFRETHAYHATGGIHYPGVVARTACEVRVDVRTLVKPILRRWNTMFIRGLSESDRRVLHSLARAMITADDVLAPEEAAMLEDIEAEMDLSVPDDAKRDDLVGLCAAVSSPEARAHILLELASVAHVDGEYADQEAKLLRGIAKEWAIEEYTVVRIEVWASRRIALAGEAVSIVREFVTPMSPS